MPNFANIESDIPMDYDLDDEEDHRRPPHLVPAIAASLPTPKSSDSASKPSPLVSTEPAAKRPRVVAAAMAATTVSTDAPAAPSVANQRTIMISKIPDQSNFVSKLAAHFEIFGTLLHCIIDRPKQRAFVQFADPASALRALKHPQAVFNNRFIEVTRVGDRIIQPPEEESEAAEAARKLVLERIAAEKKQLAEKKKHLVELKEDIARTRAMLDSLPKTDDSSAIKAQALALMTRFKECKGACDAMQAAIDKEEKEASNNS